MCSYMLELLLKRFGKKRDAHHKLLKKKLKKLRCPYSVGEETLCETALLVVITGSGGDLWRLGWLLVKTS